MTTHTLKIWPKFFAAVKNRQKTFEIRNCADRDFQVGDVVVLEEWSEDIGYTGASVRARIGYIVPIAEDTCAFSLLDVE